MRFLLFHFALQVTCAFAGQPTVDSGLLVTRRMLHDNHGECQWASVSYYRQTLFEKIAALEVEPEVRARLEAWGGRAQVHVTRLLEKQRSAEENTFGLAVLNHYDELQAKFAEYHPMRWHELTKVIGDQGPNTTLWWTLGPYLYRGLREEGMSEFDALTRLCLWAEVPLLEGTHSYYELTLPGIAQKAVQGDTGEFYLEGDPNHFSNQYALRLARRLLAEKKIPELSAFEWDF